MLPPVCIVDTNIAVSGLIGADRRSPPARILN
ncbi:MAG: twitching motility protein PilT, partial [Gammaproteobacteria bacterium]|nr:twitching motility protein PilT [Gammaproteobacteria bacterium]